MTAYALRYNYTAIDCGVLQSFTKLCETNHPKQNFLELESFFGVGSVDAIFIMDQRAHSLNVFFNKI